MFYILSILTYIVLIFYGFIFINYIELYMMYVMYGA